MTPTGFDAQSFELRERLAEVRETIGQAARASGRSAEDVTLVAVSKYHPASAIAALHALGQLDFGENYMQEALSKQDELAGLPLRWHFIGHLQSNKARFLPGRFSMIHSIHSLKLARTLHKVARKHDLVMDVLLQVNLAGEERKSGIAEQDAEALAGQMQALDGLRLAGLMVMPPFFDDPERARPYFARLRKLRDELEKRLGARLPHLSMGMTGDYAAAIEEGATLVRIGTRLFGPRPGN